MAIDYQKRLSLLKSQTDEENVGRLKKKRTIFLSLIAFAFISYLASFIFPSELASKSSKKEISWNDEVTSVFQERYQWLKQSPFSVVPGASYLYKTYSKLVLDALLPSTVDTQPATVLDVAFDPDDIFITFFRWTIVTLLRLGFLIISFSPIWGIGFAAGYYLSRNRFIGAKSKDILGVCDRGKGPFYSGIYGPLKYNNSISGTDLGCPGLACPAMVTELRASTHELTSILKRFGAFNKTNEDLVRIVIQYGDFPAVVESEQSSESNIVDDGMEKLEEKRSKTAFVSNELGKLEESTILGLKAVLSAQKALQDFFKFTKERKTDLAALNSDFALYKSLIAEFVAKLDSRAAIFLNSLTPNRAYAIGAIPSTALASAYLATEAGKCLVFKRTGEGFAVISLLPHLQARAVLQSIPALYEDYNGDTRLIMRQAIISSRRHGDFGRAFLPEKMPIESRAIRDLLEICYAEPHNKELSAYLVELDAHLEEISVNWKGGYQRFIRSTLPSLGDSLNRKLLNRGIPFKSVVLIPVEDLIEIALFGVDNHRIDRIVELLGLTKKYQSGISISARLPGFKRQALEAEKSVDELESMDPGSRDRYKRWVVVRRMLTKYNWLSTRVGDDAVPDEGYVHGLVELVREDETAVANVEIFEALAPIRQRRFVEMFGAKWEHNLFKVAPHPEKVTLLVDSQKFNERCELIRSRGGKTNVVNVAFNDRNMASR
jgi:hypothetical protein